MRCLLSPDMLQRNYSITLKLHFAAYIAPMGVGASSPSFILTRVNIPKPSAKYNVVEYTSLPKVEIAWITNSERLMIIDLVTDGGAISSTRSRSINSGKGRAACQLSIRTSGSAEVKKTLDLNLKIHLCFLLWCHLSIQFDFRWVHSKSL